MSGIDAQRGFIFQSIVAIIECLERTDWDEIKLEPHTDGDKVDIQLLKQRRALVAIQVKSSKKAFTKPDVERWLKETKSDASEAEEIIVYLVGDSYTSACESFIKQNAKEIKRISFNSVLEICIAKLAEYLKRTGMSPKVSVADLDLIGASLFDKIHKNSIGNESLSRDAFDEVFQTFLLPSHLRVFDGETRLLSEYYAYIVNKFCEKPEEREASLFGDEPTSSSYLDPYYEKDGETHLLIDGVENWCDQREQGVMLLHGEPGHGKTSFCRKCVYEFNSGNRFKRQKNVFVFSINPARSDILAESRLKIETAFTWGVGNPLIPVTACREGVVFLDGFDEFIDEARSKGFASSIIDFMDTCSEYSKEHKMKIIITSRSLCINDYLSDVQKRYTALKFAPLSTKQQKDWILARKKYAGYFDIFSKINVSETMKSITGIPILFRMIVEMRFDKEIDGRAELYQELFYLTQKRQRVSETVIWERHEKFEDIAYAIFADNDDTTEIDDESIGAAWTYSYYVKVEGKRRLGFLHRSFYEYFLASFLLNRLKGLKSDKEIQSYIQLLSVRKLSREQTNSIRSVYMKLKRRERNEGSNDIVRMFQTFLDYISRNCITVLMNILNSIKMSYEQLINWIECAFFNTNALNYALLAGAQIEINKGKDKIDEIDFFTHLDMRVFGKISRFIDMKGVLLRGDFSLLNVENAYLEDSVISCVLLHNVNMPSTHLQGSHLTFTQITKSVMRGSSWNKAIITGVKFKEVDLFNSTFIKSKLHGVDCDRVKMSHSDFSGARITASSFHSTDFSFSYFADTTIKESVFASDCDFTNAFIPVQLRPMLEDQGIDTSRVIWLEESGT